MSGAILVRDIQTTATTWPAEKTGVAVKTRMSPRRDMLLNAGLGSSLIRSRTVAA